MISESEALEFIKNEFDSRASFKSDAILTQWLFILKNFRTEEFYSKAVTIEPLYIELLKNPSIVLCEQAIKLNPEALAYVPEQIKTYSFCLKVTKQNFECINFIPQDFKTFSFILELAKFYKPTNRSPALKYLKTHLQMEFKTPKEAIDKLTKLAEIQENKKLVSTTISSI